MNNNRRHATLASKQDCKRKRKRFSKQTRLPCPMCSVIYNRALKRETRRARDINSRYKFGSIAANLAEKRNRDLISRISQIFALSPRQLVYEINVGDTRTRLTCQDSDRYSEALAASPGGKGPSFLSFLPQGCGGGFDGYPSQIRMGDGKGAR